MHGAGSTYTDCLPNYLNTAHDASYALRDTASILVDHGFLSRITCMLYLWHHLYNIYIHYDAALHRLPPHQRTVSKRIG